jgi:hypothetical protein
MTKSLLHMESLSLDLLDTTKECSRHSKNGAEDQTNFGAIGPHNIPKGMTFAPGHGRGPRARALRLETRLTKKKAIAASTDSSSPTVHRGRLNTPKYVPRNHDSMCYKQASIHPVSAGEVPTFQRVFAK